jgi:hypothetical protein
LPSSSASALPGQWPDRVAEPTGHTRKFRQSRYWWVNQNQTYRHEVNGGYLWSPKRNANGARNPFYESMREVAPGDLIFSFMDTRIVAVGIAQSYCWESPKPLEFGNAGQNWENIGWRVKVEFTELANRIRPKDHIDILRPLLPDRYSPLQPTGNGKQSVYLTQVPIALAEVLSRWRSSSDSRRLKGGKRLGCSFVASCCCRSADLRNPPLRDMAAPERHATSGALGRCSSRPESRTIRSMLRYQGAPVLIFSLKTMRYASVVEISTRRSWGYALGSGRSCRLHRVVAGGAERR